MPGENRLFEPFLEGFGSNRDGAGEVAPGGQVFRRDAGFDVLGGDAQVCRGPGEVIDGAAGGFGDGPSASIAFEVTGAEALEAWAFDGALVLGGQVGFADADDFGFGVGNGADAAAAAPFPRGVMVAPEGVGFGEDEAVEGAVGVTDAVVPRFGGRLLVTGLPRPAPGPAKEPAPKTSPICPPFPRLATDSGGSGVRGEAACDSELSGLKMSSMTLWRCG